MPSFLSRFRRKSRADSQEKVESTIEHVGVNGSSQSQNNGQDANGSVSRRKSSSTSELSATTPATSTSESLPPKGPRDNTPPLPPLHTRPARPSVNISKRYSTNGVMSPSGGSQMSVNPSSLLAPRVLSAPEGPWIVHQQVLLIFGQIGDSSYRPLDGQVTVNHHHGHFPTTQWPVCESYFKALVYLEPGPNRIRLDFSSPKISSSGSSISPHASFVSIQYIPLNNIPPLQLAIILGSDSPGTYDVMPDRMKQEGNGLDLAIKKFRTAAYLWQAFTGEQMSRNGYGPRCFRFEEAWEPSTLSYDDWNSGKFRTQAKVHIIRSKRTVAEIRDLNHAQQYDKAKDKDAMHRFADEAVREYFQVKPGQTHYVACLMLDSQWDKKAKTIRGHAALGSMGGDVRVGVFGSHALWSYPSSLDEVAQAFQDCTRTDTAFVGNDCGESGSSWEAANIGIGAHLHEVGHLFGNPHRESGVMARDYTRLNRTFVCREPYSTRTKSPGQKLVLQHDECNWHRLDILRFRFSEFFRIPRDITVGDPSVQVWTVDSGQGGIIATSSSGIAWVELYLDGDGDECHYWHQWPENDGQYPRQVTLNEVREWLPKEKREKRLKLLIYSAGGGMHIVEDFSVLVNQKLARVRLPDGRVGYRGSRLGYSQMEGSMPQEVILDSAHMSKKLLVSIKIYHGFALDGIEFIYEDSTSQLFGKRGGTPGGSEFALDTRRGELLCGFALRAGLWIDGLQVMTTLGRRSPMYGNPNGGSGHTLIPPRGYTIGGITGSCAQWVDGFSLIITR